MVSMSVKWDDPNLREHAQAFFALNYLENFNNESLRMSAKADTPKDSSLKDAASGEGAKVDKGLKISLSTDDYPEESIDGESVKALLRLHHETKVAYSRPLEVVDTPEAAACVLLERFLLNLAKSYLFRVAMYLAADKSYHPERRIKIDAAPLLDIASDDMATRLDDLPKFLALGNLLFPDQPPNSAFAVPLAVFEHSVAIFFDVLDQVFTLKAIGKCRRAYDHLFLKLGTRDAIAEIPNLVRRHKTMYREILNFKSHGGAASEVSAADIGSRMAEMRDELKNISAQTGAALSAIKGVDRRQRDLAACVRKAIGGFVGLFRPKPKPIVPSREEVAAALPLPKGRSDRYACLERINEPHRSQIKAVIDYTLEHPIVFASKKKDDFTLSDAARAVFNENESKWEKVTGSFSTWSHLKSACYNLQGKETDPFNYR